MYHSCTSNGELREWPFDYTVILMTNRFTFAWLWGSFLMDKVFLLHIKVTGQGEQIKSFYISNFYFIYDVKTEDVNLFIRFSEACREVLEYLVLWIIFRGCYINLSFYPNMSTFHLTSKNQSLQWSCTEDVGEVVDSYCIQQLCPLASLERRHNLAL